MLAEKEGQQHQHASIVDDPPHVNVTLGEALSIGREGSDVLRDEQCQVSSGGFSDQLCRTDTQRGTKVLVILLLQTIFSLFKLLSQELFTCLLFFGEFVSALLL